MTEILRPLIVACGALARDLELVLRLSQLDTAIEVHYLPANLHNRPERIVPALRPILDDATIQKRPVFIGYSDCGTGGLLDALLSEYPGVERLPGAHCYELFAGSAQFAQLHDAEPGTFYLTNYLALHFEALVWNGLGLTRHPELRDAYFGNYRRVIWLRHAEGNDTRIDEAAHRAAQLLNLPLVIIAVDRQPLVESVRSAFVGALSASA